MLPLADEASNPAKETSQTSVKPDKFWHAKKKVLSLSADQSRAEWVEGWRHFR